MKVLVLGATGGTGRLIVSDAVAKGHSVVALVRSPAGADLPGAELIEGDARNESTSGAPWTAVMPSSARWAPAWASGRSAC
jgi:uncharacterized protein YbjT (DUF2867 family)